MGSEAELGRRILGFSISHDNDNVRIYSHYLFIEAVALRCSDGQQEQQASSMGKYHT